MDIDFVLMVIGFSLAAYAIVANDSIQTLGTFMGSNAHRPWWILWLFAMTVLTITLVYGWVSYDGDVSYGRLEKFPQPEEFTVIYLLPPILVLILTRFNIPVSTTFLVLTVFVSANFQGMLYKSLLGYLIAIVSGVLIYLFVAARAEKYFIRTNSGGSAHHPKNQKLWVTLQWLSTALLWSQWLVQDLANIFVYAPSSMMNSEGVRSISLTWLVLSLLWFYLLHAWMFYAKGGGIQKIVLTKTNIQDIRSATIVDFLYALILIVFKQMSNIPMSTTWVFIGLLAGREFAIAYLTRMRTTKEVVGVVSHDLGKASIGILVSVALALCAPFLHDLIHDRFSL